MNTKDFLTRFHWPVKQNTADGVKVLQIIWEGFSIYEIKHPLGFMPWNDVIREQKWKRATLVPWGEKNPKTTQKVGYFFPLK